MKRMNLWMVCLLLAGATLTTSTLTSCSNDDDVTYAVPTMNMETQPATVDLSDGTTYTLPVNIKSEAGLASIVVKDGSGKEWLNQTSFSNPNDVATVDLDLSSATETQLLLLTVTATDKAGKTVTSPAPYSLNVLVPQLYVAFGNTATISDKLDLNMTIGKGVKALSKVTVYLNDSKVQDIALSGDAAKAKKQVQTVSLTGLKDGKNPVKVEVYEEGASTPALTESIDVNKINMDNVYLQISNTDEQRNYDLALSYDDNNRVSDISFTYNGLMNEDYTGFLEAPQQTVWTIEGYNKAGMVTKLEETGTKDMENEEPSHVAAYEFTYNAFNELTKVTKEGADYVTDVVYENGVIASYKIEGKEYKPAYAGANNNVRVDCLDENLSGLKFGFKGTETYNPYYVASIPAVIPGTRAGLPLQLIYSQYLFSSLGNVWTSGWTDKSEEMGTPAQSATVNWGGKNWTFTYIFDSGE